MHECPECWAICYCDLDDSNDCRVRGQCFHQCQNDDADDLEYGADDEEAEPAALPHEEASQTAPASPGNEGGGPTDAEARALLRSPTGKEG